MKLKIFSLLMTASLAHAGEHMRIAIALNVDRVTVSGAGLFFGADTDVPQLTALPVTQVSLVRSGQSLLLENKALPLRTVRFHSEGGTLTANGTALRGDVVVTLGKSKIDIVNVLELEEYLVGVLGGEMPQSFPLEALKAQAVAARTYALSKKLELYSQPFFVGATVLSQVYRGLSAEAPRTREAVEATRGLVLTHQLEPIEAYFHSSCGGHTENGFDALGRDLPYLKSVECPCGSLPSTHWNLTLSKAELKNAVGANGVVSIQGRTATGRARRVAVGDSTVDAVRFRERLGYAKLKSLAFKTEAHGDNVRVEGSGFGHGAGMCQFGAKLLAEQGKDFESILKHYYPGTEMQKLY
jgi:stage II sporulation protein D